MKSETRSMRVSVFTVVFRKLIIVRVVFSAFIVAIVLIGLRFFLIPGNMSMNVVLELIVRENLWALTVYFACAYEKKP